MIRKVCLILMISSFSIYGQIFEPPVPNKDIDSLLNSLKILEIYKRANVETAFKISFEIDYNGKVKDISWKPFIKDSLSKSDKKIIIELLPKLKTIEWTPAKREGKSISIVYSIPIIFFTITDQSVWESYYKLSKNNSESNYVTLKNNDYSEPIILINKSQIMQQRISN